MIYRENAGKTLGMGKPAPSCLTLPETNIFALENVWLEDEFPFGARPIFRGENVSFRECNPPVGAL